LNEWYEPSRPGDYVVKATLTSQITTAAGQAVEAERSETVNLTVLPADPAVLAQVSEQLAATALNPSSASEAMEATLALSYVSDPVAVPHLRHVLEKGWRVTRLQAAAALARIGNRQALEALIAALNIQDEDLKPFVREALSAARATVSDAELKSKIEAALGSP
jgi:HEAT repeat protein